MKIEGETIVKMQSLSKREVEENGWEGMDEPVALVLSNGVKIFAMSDEEGNNPGILIAKNKKGEQVYLVSQLPS